jgi:hypothetical protein
MREVVRRDTISMSDKISSFVPKAWFLGLSLGLLVVCGCKKVEESPDATEVTVQVEKPKQGDISEHIMGCDAFTAGNYDDRFFADIVASGTNVDAGIKFGFAEASSFFG